MLFGKFLREKRLERNVEAKEIALRLKVSLQHIYDIEKGRRNPPDEIALNKLVDILQLTKEEAHYMFDLAGEARNNVSHDIRNYVLEENMARMALRTAKENGLGEDFWRKVNDMAKKERSE